MAAHHPGLAAPPSQGPAATTAQILAVSIPGRQMLLDWIALSDTRAILAEPIPCARDVPDVLISFLPTGNTAAFMQPDRAAVVYWAPVDAAGSDATNWSLLGALHSNLPSALFRTGWGPALPETTQQSVRLAVSLEPLAVAANLGLSAKGEAVEERRAFAAAIARDLWSFLGSFSQPNPQAQQQHGPVVQTNGEWMLLPTNIVDRWLERFNAKFSRDPNFMLKTKD